MKAMKWILGAVVATAILAPLHSANAGGGGSYQGGSYHESHRGHYRGGDYYRGHRGHRGHYRGHRGYYGPHGYYRGHRGYYGPPGYYGRPWIGYERPVVVIPLPPW